MNEDHRLETLREIIKAAEIAMLTTVAPDGALRSRPMATQQTDFDGSLWFFARTTSERTEDLQEESHVNVSYSQPNKNRYASISGTAMLVRDKSKMQALWKPLYKAWFPKGLDDSELALIRVRAEQAEFWEGPSIKIVALAEMFRAAASGTPFSSEENSKMNLPPHS